MPSDTVLPMPETAPKTVQDRIPEPNDFGKPPAPQPQVQKADEPKVAVADLPVNEETFAAKQKRENPNVDKPVEAEDVKVQLTASAPDDVNSIDVATGNVDLSSGSAEVTLTTARLLVDTGIVEVAE